MVTYLPDFDSEIKLIIEPRNCICQVMIGKLNQYIYHKPNPFQMMCCLYKRPGGVVSKQRVKYFEAKIGSFHRLVIAATACVRSICFQHEIVRFTEQSCIFRPLSKTLHVSSVTSDTHHCWLKELTCRIVIHFFHWRLSQHLGSFKMTTIAFVAVSKPQTLATVSLIYTVLHVDACVSIWEYIVLLFY